MRVIVTGASGFVGRTLLPVLSLRSHEIVAAMRAAPSDRETPSNSVAIGDINAATNWSAALHGADAVVHLAARVHVMSENARDPLKEFRRVTWHDKPQQLG